jgi:uncharacterized protein YyaL (SSP411 family)
VTAPNRLAHETSPYLLQHAHNPVDWYPWGEEAFARARDEDRPIFLSVGYSACHWCHVMEHESFSHPEIATLMNAAFVNVKVDREERPDVDDVYMQAVQLFSGGHGGWPMSVFLTPSLEPFFAGTYFPPTDRHGMPGFPSVLRFAAAAYRDRRDDVERSGHDVVAALRQMAAVQPDPEMPGRDVLDAAVAAFERGFDSRAGGFGGAPKFPPSLALGFLLRRHLRTGSQTALGMVRQTLERMAHGGIHDQLGGGFHRYATDAHWLVPHFEKMLYDNALLARAYIEAWQVSGEPLFQRVARDTLDWMRREMRLPGGGFAAAQDADSEGVEGKFFVWTPDEIASVVGADEAALVCRYFGVDGDGNFEHGRSVLSVPRDPEIVAFELQMQPAELAARIDAARRSLLAARARRVTPARDDKIVVAWNALAISALAAAARAWDDATARADAEATAAFILDRSGDGALFRTFAGGRAHGVGFLDDHAGFVAALVDLYEATFEPRWIEHALRLNRIVVHEFWDDDAGGFFFTGRQHQVLPSRSRQPFDHATPSGNALATGNLLRLAALTGDADLVTRARRTLAVFATPMREMPTGMATLLCELDRALGPGAEVAIVGRDDTAAALRRSVRAAFAPHAVLAGWPDGGGAAADVALLSGRGPDGPAVHVCRDFACQTPVHDAAAVAGAFERAGVPFRAARPMTG